MAISSYNFYEWLKQLNSQFLLLYLRYICGVIGWKRHMWEVVGWKRQNTVICGEESKIAQKNCHMIFERSLTWSKSTLIHNLKFLLNLFYINLK